MAERGLCKPEVRGSNPLASTKFRPAIRGARKNSEALATGEAGGATKSDALHKSVGDVRPPEVEHSKQSKAD